MKSKRRIMALNINDLGGISNHLMEHRYFNNRDRRTHIDWKYWARHIDKKVVWNSLKEYIKDKNPDVLVLEEMLISSYEENYVGELEKMGYSYIEDSLPKKGNYSLTLIFFKGESPEYLESPGEGYRGNRSVVYKWNDLLLCGSHFPSESDKVFLDHMSRFVINNMEKHFLLIGDLNANDPKRGNKQMVNKLIDNGAVDLWISAGNAEDIPTEAKYHGRLDYAIASPSLVKRVKNIDIDSFPMDSGMTDHAAVIVDILN